jgi:hypothetical protein
MLVLDMIEILPPLEKYKYDIWRIFPMKCYIDNSVLLRSCIRNVKHTRAPNFFGHLICNSSTILFGFLK